MDEERVERESRHLKKKGKHRDEDGKAKDKSKRGREEEAAGTDLSADIRENAKDEAVMGAAEEKEGHKSKKGKGRSEEKKGKVNVPLVSGSIENCVGEEQAKKSGSVALKPCPESATNKDNVKKDKKKKEGKKKEKEAETTEQTQSFDTSVGKEQAETSGLMVINPCLERGASKDNVKKDKKKKKEEKKKEKEADTTEQKQSFDTAVGKEQAETSGLERAEGDTSKHNLNKDKKKKEEKKEEKEAEMTGQKKQTLDTTVDNSGAEYAERDKVEVKQSSKSKKSKRKHDGGAPAAEISAADQIVKREDKKRKKEHSVVLEESSQTRDKGETREVKKGGKESSKACPDYSENAFAGGEEAGVNGKNDKKKKKSKGIGGGKKEKEKAARSMKGKQVSFADSVEMFRTEGSDGEGIGGGKQKKRAAPSKKKGKRVSFADSAEVFSIEGGDNEEDVRSNESKLVHGDQFTPEEDTTLMEAMSGYVEMKQLGEKGLEMLRYVRKYPEVKGCWHDIAKSLPHRPYISIYGRAQTLLSRSADCKWTDEEKEQIRRFVEKNGKDWKTLAQELGKSEILVKGAWRRIRPKKRKGADNEEDGSSGESKLVHGRRFTAEEDAILMEAMRDYTELKQLGEKGLEMIRSCKKYPTLKGCWDDIGKSLPHRPREAIYKRAHILLDRSAERKWTDEERDRIKRFVLENGTDFKTLAKELGKSRIHLKDTWRRIKPKNLIKGRWTQEEHQNLFDLVNLDLRLKAHQIKISDHRMLRENISWEAISDKLTTRNHKNCCLKWYDTLASPMVKEGIWADVDDYLLVEALQNVDAVCIEDVDWDSVLDHRSGEVCRRRWNQMVRAIGGHREKPFIEQVEVLSTRYCPEMMEYRN